MAQATQTDESDQILIQKLDFVPPIRKLYPQIYPSKFLSVVENSDLKLIKTHENKSKSSAFQTLTLETFEKNFVKYPHYYDLTEINFQNFALTHLKNEKAVGLRHLSHSPSQAQKRILRAATYAIASRDDINWDGTFIEASNTTLRQQKKQQLEELWKSLKLYDWTLAPQEELTKLVVNRFEKDCQFDMWKMDTQSAVEKLNEQHPDAKICWLSMANAHDALGTYHSYYGGSQEEDLASNSTIAATLGLRMDFVSSGLLGYFTGVSSRAVYKDGFHIPPGGCYFSSCKLITSTPQIDCYVIAAAFADFRMYWPLSVPWSERTDYYYQWGHVKHQELLELRLALDMEAVCRTAIKEGIDILVLGASGCGVYRHNAWMEARMWQEVLSKYAKAFKKVVFAVLADASSPQNAGAFTYYFKNKEGQSNARS